MIAETQAFIFATETAFPDLLDLLCPGAGELVILLVVQPGRLAGSLAELRGDECQLAAVRCGQRRQRIGRSQQWAYRRHTDLA
jgi:hypothetical protein